jgi:hypothetical protein
MIQQISQLSVQQKPQEHPVQTKADEGTFQSLLSNATGQLADKSTVQKDSSAADLKDEKDLLAQNDTSDKTAVAWNSSVSLAAMLQQISTQELPVQTQSTILPMATTSAQTEVALPGIQPTNPTQTGLGVQANTVPLPGQSNTNASGKENSVSVQTPVQESAPSIARGNKQIPTQENTSSSVPIANVELPLQKTELTQQSSVVPAVPQAQQQPGQTVVSAKETSHTAVQQAPKAESSHQEITSVQTQIPAAKEEKTESSVQVGAQAQNSARFSDLYSSGNVVIKVSDSSSTSAKAVYNQLTDKIAVNYKAGNPQFEMELHPQNLGKVSVKLAVREGLLTVEISALNPKTQSMLIAHSDEIKSMLQSTVNQPVRITEPSQETKLWYQQQDQSNQPQQQQQERRQNPNTYLSSSENEMTTDNFLSLMQQLKLQAISV